jgi:transposase
VTSTHTGAGEPVAGVWRGGLGCHWIVATSTRVCVLAEVPPDRRREGDGRLMAKEGRDAMEVMFDRVAGLDVGKETVTVCLRTPGPRGGRHAETRTFKTMTGSLRVMRDWLVEAGVSIAAMESTSAYWKAPFYCLEEVMDVWLLNAAHMKAVPGRKSDVRDAEWIAQLLEHGLLRPSFVPPPEIRRLRMLTRYRVQLMGDRRRDIVRLELMLEDASIKLSSVASSLKTVSARAILTAMINGETDPLRLADLAKGRMRRKIPDLALPRPARLDDDSIQLRQRQHDQLQPPQH